MIATLSLATKNVTIDLSKPLDISLPLKHGDKNPKAWYIGTPKIVPEQIDDWVGKVSEGASVNFNGIYFNPHAHGTHTECLGHITKDFHTVTKALQTYFFTAQVITVKPEVLANGDRVLTKQAIKNELKEGIPQALILRTAPNTDTKKTKLYDNDNWPYLSEDAAQWMCEQQIAHLLVDMPSVDKEKDDGKLLAHRAFWNIDKTPRTHATITELIFVPNSIKDGAYILNLMIAPFYNDASPSKPTLYKIITTA